ncbi:MAG: hypothetical protein GEU96_04045 [Propionibacteriales bacterium]|nr:hypothetical protein [Propionibacteriales bacterium]
MKEPELERRQAAMCRMWLKVQSVPEGQFGRIVSDSTSPRANSEEPGMLRSRVVLATFLVVTCAACSQNGASPAPSANPDPTTSAPSAPASSVQPELAGYSEDEQAAYEAAVTAYDAFIKRNDKFYAAGETTVEAKNFYQRYAVDWSTAWGNLAQVANNKVTVTGTTKTVWTKPRSIELGTVKGDVIVLRRCLDESGRVVTQNGHELEQPQFKDPHIYTIRLEKRPSEDRWRSGVAEQGQTC